MIGGRIPISTTWRCVFQTWLTNNVSPATGKTVAVTISKNGAAFGNPSAGATNATEIANGFYYVDLSTTDTGTAGPLLVRGTASGCEDAYASAEVGSVDANVKTWVGSAPDALSSGKVPADLKLWLTAAPAALSTNGYVQAMLLRWLTDNAGGTPNALQSGRTDSYLGAVATGAIAAASFAAGAIDAAAIATDAIGALELAAGAASEIATAVRTELATELGRVDVAVSTRLSAAGYTAPDNADIVAIKAKTDNLPASPSATGDAMTLTAAYDAAKTAATQTSVDAIGSDVDALPTSAQIADKVLGRNLAGASDGGRTVRDSLRVSRNKVVVDGTTITVYAEDDVTVAWQGVVTRDGTLNTLSAVDPA